jgi:WD40 repeat protein
MLVALRSVGDGNRRLGILRTSNYQLSRRGSRLAALVALLTYVVCVGHGYGESLQSTKDGDTAHIQIVQRLSLKDYLQAIAWSPDGSKLAALSSFGSLITIWDTHSWRKIREISQFGGTYAGDSLAWTHDGMVLASAGAKVPEDGIYSLNLWNPNTGELVKRIVGPPVPEGAWKHNQAAKFVLSNDRSLLAMTFLHTHDQLIIFDTSNWTINRVLDIPVPSSAQRGSATSFAFSPNNKVIAITNSRDLQTISLEDGSVIFSILAYEHSDPHAGPIVDSLTYSPDGNVIAGAATFFPSLINDTGPVRIWSAANGTLIAKLPTRDSSFGMISWSQDGAKLAAAGAGGIVQVLQIEPDVSKSKVVLEFGDARAGLVAFSPDGRLAAGGHFSVMIIK